MYVLNPSFDEITKEYADFVKLALSIKGLSDSDYWRYVYYKGRYLQISS
jgi:hypothetical protein